MVGTEICSFLPLMMSHFINSIIYVVDLHTSTIVLIVHRPVDQSKLNRIIFFAELK